MLGSTNQRLSALKKEMFYDKFATMARRKSLKWLWNITGDKRYAIEVLFKRTPNFSKPTLRDSLHKAVYNY